MSDYLNKKEKLNERWRLWFVEERGWKKSPNVLLVFLIGNSHLFVLQCTFHLSHLSYKVFLFAQKSPVASTIYTWSKELSDHCFFVKLQLDLQSLEHKLNEVLEAFCIVSIT